MYNINNASQQTLNNLADVFVEFPDTNILVVGHTDSTGSSEYNMELSRKRANSVTDYLTSKSSNSSRYTVNWYGEQQPVHDNATSEGRAKNRRVNITILPNQKMIDDAKQQSGEN